jgi:hypothetical protein
MVELPATVAVRKGDQPTRGRILGGGGEHHPHGEDLYLRECWADAAAVLGEQLFPVLERVALLITKPDAVVGRRLRQILAYAQDHGFLPVAAFPLALTRHSIRELWRNDWTVYSTDRLALATVFYTAADTLAIFLRDVDCQPRSAACARLSRLKGSAFPELRAAEDLRTMLAPPNRVLNFVHVPDGTIDLVREIGVLFDKPERQALFSRIEARFDSGDADEVDRAVARLEARFAPHDLDFDRSLDRLLKAGFADEATARKLATLHLANATLPWAEFYRLVTQPADPLQLWDFITVASHLIPLERDDRAELPSV